MSMDVNLKIVDNASLQTGNIGVFNIGSTYLNESLTRMGEDRVFIRIYVTADLTEVSSLYFRLVEFDPIPIPEGTETVVVAQSSHLQGTLYPKATEIFIPFPPGRPYKKHIGLQYQTLATPPTGGAIDAYITPYASGPYINKQAIR